ncbi:MAG: hypothetical protein DWC10_03055 [Candidatus Poseidoniales archaeon]|nr:MAG: hypothetical protein DWC10_03055 [Candidatus Poseidoniales archaeon]
MFGQSGSTSGGSSRPHRGPVVQNEHPCQNGCGRMTWTGHTLCKTCFSQANFGQKQPSPSQMDSYNRIVAMVGGGTSEAEFRANLTNAHGFYEGDVNALCASPTVRQLMGW